MDRLKQIKGKSARNWKSAEGGGPSVAALTPPRPVVRSRGFSLGMESTGAEGKEVRAAQANLEGRFRESSEEGAKPPQPKRSKPWLDRGMCLNLKLIMQ